MRWAEIDAYEVLISTGISGLASRDLVERTYALNEGPGSDFWASLRYDNISVNQLFICSSIHTSHDYFYQENRRRMSETIY